MGTQGCVAFVTADGGWCGVHNAIDSSPSALGLEVWTEFHGRSSEALQALARELLREGRWENFWAGDEQQEPILVDSTHPDPLFIAWV